MKHLTFVLIAILTLCSCKKDDPTPDTPEEVSGRVILAYLISNNSGTSLDSDLKNNIRWMYESLAEMNQSASLLVFYRPYSNDKVLTSPCILRFTTDGHGRINGEEALTDSELNNNNVLQKATIVKEYNTESQFIATAPETMQTVISDMRSTLQATSYGLIFGSHATGWIEGSKTVSARSFGDDKGYSINIPEMANAIKNGLGGKKADFILFDACMMGLAEVYYELRDVTDYCVASVLESPMDGLPYNRFLPSLYKDKADLKQVIDSTIAFNTEQRTWGTYALVDCNQMESLAQAVQEQVLTNADLAKNVPYTDSSQLLQYGYGSAFKYFSFDMLEFIKLLNNGSVPEAFQTAFDNAVIYKSSMSDNRYLKENNRYSGMGMYLPDRGIKANWDNYYPTFGWYNAAGWSALNN